jgi:hypothetical protein
MSDSRLWRGVLVSRMAQRISKLVLPPGSLVCFGHHMPHYVAPITEGHGTRHGLLMVYRR